MGPVSIQIGSEFSMTSMVCLGTVRQMMCLPLEPPAKLLVDETMSGSAISLLHSVCDPKVVLIPGLPKSLKGKFLMNLDQQQNKMTQSKH